MRTNSMKYFTISQHTSWNFDKKEITWYIGTEDMPTLYAHSEYGDALILPIRIKKEGA